MCRVYTRKKRPEYIRLCYKTGRAGQRVPLSDYTWRCLSQSYLGQLAAEAGRMSR